MTLLPDPRLGAVEIGEIGASEKFRSVVFCLSADIMPNRGFGVFGKCPTELCAVFPNELVRFAFVGTGQMLCLVQQDRGPLSIIDRISEKI